MREAGPDLALDWEEGLFRGLLRLWMRYVHPPPPPSPTAFRPATARRELEVLASLAGGRPLRLVDGAVGGLRGAEVVLPVELDLAGSPAGNAALARLRALVAGQLVRSGASGPDAAGDAAALRAACRALSSALPGFEPALAEVVRSAGGVLLPEGGPDDDTLVRLFGRRLSFPDAASGGGGPEALRRATGRERPGKPVDEVRRVHLDEEKARERVVTHSFEKIETLEEARGQRQRMDGSDDLDAHAEALDELDLREVIRGGAPAEAMLRVEAGLGTGVADVADVAADERGVSYDEWDEGRQRFRRGWCTVYPTPVREGDAAWAVAARRRLRREIEALHARLLTHRQRRRTRCREREGDDVDLDALVDDVAARRAGRGRSERLFVAQPRAARSVATTVLLDVSLSTDAWIDDTRVLDVVRDAALVLGEVADRLGDDVQVLAFASHTRNRCRVWTLRDWGESWAAARGRLGALRPQGYTRIGPALRHAAAELVRRGADRRVLLLVSDGRPTDLDAYEGAHGIADVRHALREARARGVHPHVLAIDRSASAALAATFGEGAWQIVPHPRGLPEALAVVYARAHG